MAYPFTVTVNFDILCECHIEASTKPGELEFLGINPAHAVVEITLQSIKSKQDLKNLIEDLECTLGDQLNEHQDHFIYLFYLFYEVDAPFYKEKEIEIRHAASRVDKMIELQRLKEQCSPTDLRLSIKGPDELSIAIEGIILNKTWNDIYNSLLNSYIITGSNFFLIERLKSQEISLQLLKNFRSELKLRKNSFWNKALASFSNMLLFYLNKQHIMQSETQISYKQANLIYNLLETFQLLGKKVIKSPKDDYIKALLRNNGYL